MGISSSIEKNMQANTENMMKKQAEMAFKQRQMMLATSFALGKERFLWFSYFYYTMMTICILAGIKKRNPVLLAPVISLSFIYGYQYDLYHRNKLVRIRHEAERLIREEPELFFPPNNNGIYSTEEYIKGMNYTFIVSKK